jgi:hypothetical protein
MLAKGVFGKAFGWFEDDRAVYQQVAEAVPPGDFLA